ncbi:MAG: hypothetical protein HW414_190, partial [Dehalococcoidia bacterium]|nr:hypothetical protein [Dehalococcoidia bacterium]
MKVVRILLLGLVLLLPSATHVLADSGARYQEKEIDGHMVRLIFGVDTVQLGHNQISIHIKDGEGKPVADARVTVIAELYEETSSGSSSGGHSMDMGQSSSTETSPIARTLVRIMKAEMTAGKESGEYEGELNLDKAGHWMIMVNSVVNQQERSVEFAQEVSKSGPNW